mmetsp:Transcript_23547/g.32948  ORF Transcript_23547/g.32948 Transcript_23547/m.32948 type:complete len:547 (+) Transcript_23547:40-1680(+)
MAHAYDPVQQLPDEKEDFTPSAPIQDHQPLPVVQAEAADERNGEIDGQQVQAVEAVPAAEGAQEAFNGEGIGAGAPPPAVIVGGLCDCTRDEESGWHSFWCCSLVAARTYDSFGLQKAWIHLTISAALFILLILLTVAMGFLGLLVGLVAFFSHRAILRGRLRHLVMLPGGGNPTMNFVIDLATHCCCAACIVAQEARIAKSERLPYQDFITGQRIQEEDVTPIDAENVGLLAHLKQLSLLSKITIGLYVGFSLLLPMFLSHFQMVSISVLVMVFPIAVLYFLYWRTSRACIPLDTVIKLFASGYVVAVVSAIVFEGILEVLFGVILFLLFGGVITKAMKEATDGGGDDGGSNGGQHFMGGNGALFGLGLGDRIKGFLSHLGGGSSASLFGNLFADDAARGGGNGYDEEKVRELLGKYILLVLLIAFLFLFVIPGCVEEYTKHMSVRATWLPHPLRSPRAVCIALVSAALGFATKENLQYVFSVGRSNYEGELALLGLRSLFPVHAICAGIQAVQMIKRDFQHIPLSLPKLLAPAVSVFSCPPFSW